MLLFWVQERDGLRGALGRRHLSTYMDGNVHLGICIHVLSEEPYGKEYFLCVALKHGKWRPLLRLSACWVCVYKEARRMYVWIYTSCIDCGQWHIDSSLQYTLRSGGFGPLSLCKSSNIYMMAQGRVIIIEIAKNHQYVKKTASLGALGFIPRSTVLKDSFSCVPLSKLLSFSFPYFSLAGAQRPPNPTEGVSFSLTPGHGRACEGGDFSCRIWPGSS